MLNPVALSGLAYTGSSAIAEKQRVSYTRVFLGQLTDREIH